MPSIANVTVKKNDGTTDIVYTALSPSSGDTVPAIWRSQSVGTSAALRPEVRMKSTYNGPKTARRLDVQYSFPSVQTVSGIDQVTDRVVINASVLTPLGSPDTDVNEAVSQCMNLLVSTLFKDSFKSGFAPT